MATSCPSCGVCDLRHLTKPPKVWCTECDEGLCAECQEHHSLSKASRSHNVIPIVEYQKLPTDVLKITQYCSKHDKKFQIYCQKHECPCCSMCVVDSHKHCDDIVNLDEVIHDAKTSNALCEIEETLVEVAENLHTLRKHNQDNLSTLEEKRNEIEKIIKKTRTKINNHLDKLQEDFMTQLYAIKEKEDLKIVRLLSSIEKKENEIAECQRNIGNIKEHATDLQVFLSMKKIEENISNNEKFVQALVKDGDHALSYTINTAIKNVMSKIISFGEINIENKSCEIVLTTKKVKQAQIMIPSVRSRSIDDIKLTIHKTFSHPGQGIRGCCMIPDGRMALTDYYGHTVTVFSKDGSTDFNVDMTIEPFDIVYINQDNTMAVSSGGSPNRCITIIDIRGKQIKKTISLDSLNYGISLKGNRLIYSGADKGIRMINVYDESRCEIVQDRMPSFGYTATYRDNLYHTCERVHSVTCYNLQGKLQWTFHNEKILKSPRGIAVDNDGNAYVLGGGPYNMVVISPDGQRHKEVLTESDGLYNSTAVHYDGSNNQLLVSNYSCKAFLFNLV